MQIVKDCQRVTKIAKPGTVQKNLHSVPNLCHPQNNLGQSKFPNHGKSCFLISDSLSLFCFFMEKGVDVENQKSTVLTDAPAEV